MSSFVCIRGNLCKTFPVNCVFQPIPVEGFKHGEFPNFPPVSLHVIHTGAFFDCVSFLLASDQLLLNPSCSNLTEAQLNMMLWGELGLIPAGRQQQVVMRMNGWGRSRPELGLVLSLRSKNKHLWASPSVINEAARQIKCRCRPSWAAASRGRWPLLPVTAQ